MICVGYGSLAVGKIFLLHRTGSEWRNRPSANLVCGSIDLNSKPMVALGKEGTPFLRVQGASGETGRLSQFHTTEAKI